MDKILNNLGLCMRASKLLSGEELVVEGIRSGKVYYVFLASDAGESTKKKLFDKTKYYGIEICLDYTSAQLSHAIGKTNRMVIGIIDKNFLKILKK